jgi:predicted RNA-binding protein with PIN domain
VPDPTLYLFDGYNLLHAGAFEGPRELRDALASFVALKGARGVLVFDGVGADETIGPLEVRFAADADRLLERLAAEHRDRERVLLVSSDETVRGTAGIDVTKRGSAAFLEEVGPADRLEPPRSELADRLDEGTRARLERLRRGE